MKKIILISLLFILSHCDIKNDKLLLINNTNKAIYYRVLSDTNLSTGIYIYTVEAFKSDRPTYVMGGNGAWEYKINHDSKDSTLHIFFFQTPILDNEIINGHKYTRLDFKIKDLDRLKWVVVYDGK
jgi:hypothetical protein